MNISTLSLLPIWEDAGIAIGPGTKRPVGFTRGELSELLLRARRFVFSTPLVTGSGTVINGDDSVGGWSFSAGGTIEESGNLDDYNWPDESAQVGARLVIGFANVDAVAVNGYVVTGDHPLVGDAGSSATILLSVDSTTDPIVRRDDLYWPRLELTATGAAGSLLDCTVWSEWRATPPGSSALSTNVTVLGREVELRGYSTFMSGDYSGSVSIHSGMEVSIAEWRSYGGRWSTSTGARIGDWAG